MSPDSITNIKNQKLSYRLFAGGIPLTALLTAIFYLQGRAYLAGFLRYFQIDSSQITITTADAMWYAYNGWGNGAASILLKSGRIFIDLINQFAPITTSFSVIAICALLLINYTKRNSAPAIEAAPKTIKPKTKNKFLLFLALMVGYIISIPTTIIFLAFAVVITVSVTVEPFSSLGTRSAAKYCDTPVTLFPTIPSLPGFDPEKGVIYQLLCGTDTCAVLQANIPSVVLKDSIKITTSPPLSSSQANDSNGNNEKLCTKRGIT